MKKALLIIFSLFLVGCSSQGVVNNQSMMKTTSDSKAILNFVVVQSPADNNDMLLFGDQFKAHISIDGRKIAKIGKNETTQTLVSPGSHKLSTRWDMGTKHVTLNFEADKIYYFAVGVAPVKSIVQYGDRASLTKLSKEEWESYN